MQSTHYQCSEKHHTFDFLNFAETSRFNNVSSQRAIDVLGCGLPLGYEIIHFGIHQTTTNQLASMFTTALTKNEHQRSHRPRVMSQVHDHYISLRHLRISFANAVQIAANRPYCHWISSRNVLRRQTAVGSRSRPRRPNRAPFITQRHLRQRIQYELSHAKQH